MSRLFCLPIICGAAAVLWMAESHGDPNGPPSPFPPKTIRDFGAVGDGKTDDTAALQRAVDSGAGDVRLPAGVYRISRPIVVDLDKVGPTSIVGHGTARIVMTGPGPALRLLGTHRGTADPKTVAPNVWRRQRMPIVEGIEIVGDHPQSVGIEATGTILDCEHAGMLLENVADSRVSDCLIRNDKQKPASWVSLKMVGGRGNMIVDNLLGGPPQLDPKAGHCRGNAVLQ